MRVLIYTHFFAPSVGGVEKHVLLLAEGLSTFRTRNFLEFTVVTATPAKDFDDAKLAFPVVRQPNLRTLIKLLRGADIVQLTGPSFLPLFLAWWMKKPVIVEQHLYLPVCPNGLLVDERTKNVCPGHFFARNYRECLRCNAVTDGQLGSLRKLLLTFPRRWLCQHADVNMPVTRHVDDRLKLPRSRVIYLGVAEESGTPSLQLHTIRPSAENALCFAHLSGDS